MSLKKFWRKLTCASTGCTDNPLARSGRKQARKHVRDARDFNNIETRAVIKFLFFLQGKTPKEIHTILTETLACFLPGRAKDLSAPLYNPPSHWALTPSVPSGLQAVPLQGKTPKEIHTFLTETLACFLPGRAKDLSAPLYNPPSHGAVTPSVSSGLQEVPLQGKRRRKFTPF